ncbi:MAG: hypothetical protein AAFN79_20525 [Pseudomonadota bacterium]
MGRVEAEDDTGAGPRTVRRRRVIYAHGFDPAKSDRYRRLIQRAGEGRDGVETEMEAVGPISDVSEGWRIASKRGASQVETVFEILRYEDVVRHWQRRDLFSRLATGLGSWARFAALGGLKRTFLLAKGPFLLFFYPVAMLWLFIRLGMEGFGFLGALATSHLGAPEWTWLPAEVVGLIFGLWASLRLERAFFVHLMLALFDFLVRVAEDKAPAGRLETRIDAFADRIVEVVREAQKAQVDEILIVGHSLGGLVAVRALAGALARDVDLTGGRAAVSLLTLGSVAGYVACRGGPGAEAYEASVIRLAQEEELYWADISAPRDWFSFGLVDPLLLTTDPPRDVRSPRVFSAKFGKFQPDPEDKRTRFRAMGLHMRYLGKPDRPGGFDFFECAAGAKTLEDRFAGRRDSPKAKMLGW